MLLGVRVHGDTVTNAEVALDSLFRAVPVPGTLGVPILYKKLPGTGGDDSHIRSNTIVRFMVDPDDGFAPPEWQYGGNMGPAPPVVLVRRDKLPFSKQDWDLMMDYMSEWLDEASEAEENRSEVHRRYMSPAAFRRRVRAKSEIWPTGFLSLQFPVGSTVVPSGLAAAELNGKEGAVVQYSRDRVGVRFQDRDVTALKPERLAVVREAADPPAAKHQRVDDAEARQQRRARAADIQRQESVAIARRFIECLYEDTFPEMGDLHLFGIGGEYTARAQEVLAVWQGAVKNGDVTEDSLAEALLKDAVKPFFEETCRKLAETRQPNASYAMMLIKANFAALEWEAL
mmetsp:Transcript_32632/g.91654  ORF Transcript_32632/g.91654 Transcript_32632/m.91654 type:complete len:343 (-) Transcript_32632:141-1169(-)